MTTSAAAETVPLLPERFTVERDGYEFTLPYDSSHPLTGEHEQVRHLAVMIHGVLRDGQRYHDVMLGLWEPRNDATTAVLTPQFLTRQEIEAHDLDERFPYWTSRGWSGGHDSRSDDSHPRRMTISSYEMLDELLIEAARRYPNLKRITVAGHSAGGQCVNRYVGGNRAEPVLQEQGVEVHYIVSNPSSYIYFCDDRLVCRESMTFGPLEGNDCAMLNEYRYGLGTGVTPYLLTTGIDQIPLQYAARRVTYLLGEADNDPAAHRLDRRCGALAQGEHRLERGQIYVEYLAHAFGPEVRERHRVVTVPGVGHNAAGVFGSRRGLQALFGTDEADG